MIALKNTKIASRVLRQYPMLEVVTSHMCAIGLPLPLVDGQHQTMVRSGMTTDVQRQSEQLACMRCLLSQFEKRASTCVACL